MRIIMVYFFLMLTMISLILFIIGLINPSLVIIHLKKRRFLVMLIYGTIAAVSFLLLIITSPPPQSMLPSNTEKSTITDNLSNQDVPDNLIDQKSIQTPAIDWLRESEKYFLNEEPALDQYISLSISLVTHFDKSIIITGETDLPDGSLLEILFRQLSTPKYPNQFDLQTNAIVKNNSFQVLLQAPEKYQFSQGPFQIRVFFSPIKQIPQIQSLVGKNGEKLKGKNSRIENQTRILEDIKEVSFEFEIQPSPSF